MAVHPNHYRPQALAEVLDNIRTTHRWTDHDKLAEVIQSNPSLRGMVYGYVAELELRRMLASRYGIIRSYKPDDHLKTKSDLTFVHNDREYRIQVKSVQTGSVKEIGAGIFTARIQNDASDRRRVELPNRDMLETACYVVGEYDVLAVGLHAFTRRWTFAFKKNKDLPRSTYRGYTPERRQYLLATTVSMAWPLTPDWTTDLLTLVTDPELGKPVDEGREDVAVRTDEGVVQTVDVPGSGEQVIVVEPAADREPDVEPNA